MKPFVVLAGAAALATVSAASGETSEFHLGHFWAPAAIEQSVITGAIGAARGLDFTPTRMAASTYDARIASALETYLEQRDARQASGQNTALVAYLQRRAQRQALHFAELAKAKATRIAAAKAATERAIRPALIAYLAERTRRQTPVAQTLATYLANRETRQTPTSVTLATYLHKRDDMQTAPTLQMALSKYLEQRTQWAVAAGVQNPIYAANNYGSAIMTGSVETRRGTGFSVPAPLQTVAANTLR